MEDFKKHLLRTDPSSNVYLRELQSGGFEARDEEGRELGVIPKDVMEELFREQPEE